MGKIYKIQAREILDSRGNPTVEVDVTLESGAFGRFAVPSGASTGEREAVELRDKDPAWYQGKGVQKAISNIHQIIAPKLSEQESSEQQYIDRQLCALDNTPNKSKLGANAILGVSMAVAKASANEQHKPLFVYLGGNQNHVIPTPMMNLINGGAHAHGGLDLQELMVIPHRATSFRVALQMGVLVFHNLKSILQKHGFATTVGDEGGFAPSLQHTKQALDLLMQAIEQAGFQPGKDIGLGIDAAASEFYDASSNAYRLEGKTYSAHEMVAFWNSLCTHYPILSIEDGLDQNDWAGWQLLTKELGSKVQLVGDDLFVTQSAELQKGAHRGAGNAILIKPNQVGTLSETKETVLLAQHLGYRSILSHRSGETEDTTIADLAVAWNVGQIKTGAPCRSERTAKYNQLLRIEEQLAH